MYNLFLIVGSAFIVIGLILLRIRYSPVLHRDAGYEWSVLFILLLPCGRVLLEKNCLLMYAQLSIVPSERDKSE
jgi:hypothetical protein